MTKKPAPDTGSPLANEWIDKPNGALPRSQRFCKNCDHSRLVGKELRCWESPPEPFVAGSLPGPTEFSPPRPVVIPLQRPTFPDYVCPRWVEMRADHPDFGVIETVPEHPVSEATH